MEEEDEDNFFGVDDGTDASTADRRSTPQLSSQSPQPHPPEKEKTPAASRGPSRAARRLTPKKIVLPARERWMRAFSMVLRHLRLVNMFLPQEVRHRKSRENWALLRKYKGLPPENGEPDSNNGDGGAVSNLEGMDVFSGFLPKIGGPPVDALKQSPTTAPDVVGFAFTNDDDPLPRCRAIFRKKVQDRTKNDTNVLLDIMQRVHVFKKMSYDNQVEITKIMKLRDYDENDIIVKHETEYRYLCIILKGKVKFVSSAGGIGFEIPICTYRVWDCFGQHTLSHPAPMKSTASIVCLEDSAVLMVDKHDYIRHFSQLEELETKARVEFFRSLGTFRDLDERELRPLVKAFAHVRLAHNKVVCKEGSKRTHVYVIKCGECRMLKRFQLLDDPEPVFVELGTLRTKDCIYEPTFAFHWSENSVDNLIQSSINPISSGKDDTAQNRSSRLQARRGALVHDVSVVTTTFTELYMATLNDLKAIDTPQISEAWRGLQQIHATRTAFTQQDLNSKFVDGQVWDNYKSKLVNNVIADKKVRRCQRGSNRQKILLDDR